MDVKTLQVAYTMKLDSEVGAGKKRGLILPHFKHTVLQKQLLHYRAIIMNQAASDEMECSAWNPIIEQEYLW